MKMDYEQLRESMLAATAAEDHDSMLSVAKQLRSISEPLAHASAAFAEGYVARHRGDYQASEQRLQEALDLWSQYGTTSDVYRAKMNLAVIMSFRGEHDRALSVFMECLSHYEEFESPIACIKVLNAIGTTYNGLNRYNEAASYFQRSLEKAESNGETRLAAVAIGNLAITMSRMGDQSAALQWHDRALDLCTKEADISGMARSHANAGAIYIKMGRYADALERLEIALGLYRHIKARSEEGVVLTNIAIVHSSTEFYEDAYVAQLRAIEVFEHIGNRQHLGFALTSMGDTLKKLGRHLEAIDAYEQAQTVLLGVGATSSAMTTLAKRCTAYIEANDVDTASRLWAEEYVETTHHDVNEHIHRLIIIGQIAFHTGKDAVAIETLEQALLLATEQESRDHAESCHRILREIAETRRDIDAYICHTNEMLRLQNEIRGRDATIRVATRTKERELNEVRREREREQAILYSTLPKTIAEQVIRGEDVSGDVIEHAAVIFVDIVGFTTLSSQVKPSLITALLAEIFERFDDLCEKYNVTPIKTIGDAYMAVAFPLESSSGELPAASVEERAASTAFDMLYAVANIISPARSHEGIPLNVRIGMHSGSLTAGVIGTRRRQYDVWGDTVNVASRMESTGEPGRIHVSEAFALALSPGHQSQGQRGQGQPGQNPSDMAPGTWHLAPRGEIEIKGKGRMNTYCLS